jgi:hypothetical protein
MRPKADIRSLQGPIWADFALCGIGTSRRRGNPNWHMTVSSTPAPGENE